MSRETTAVAAPPWLSFRIRLRAAALLGAALLCALVMWVDVAWLLTPLQRDTSRVGYLSDLYPRWIGSRELLLHGRNPYSPEISRESQIGFFGHVVPAGEGGGDQVAFAYPVYIAFLLAPLVSVSFETAEAIFGWLLVLVTALSVPLWLTAFRIRFPPAITGALILLAGSGFAAVQGITMQQPSLLVASLLALAMAALVKDRLLLAGALLALATIKPPLVVFLIPGLLLWSVLHWRRRQALCWGFGGMMALLLLGGEGIQPGWIPQFLAGMGDYQQYTGSESLLVTLFGSGVGLVLSAILVLLVFIVWLCAARETEAGPIFSYAVGLTLCVTVMVIPLLNVYNQVLLLPALLWLAGTAIRAWNRGSRLVRYSYLVVAAFVAAQWITAAIAVIAGVATLLSMDTAKSAVALAGWPRIPLIFVPFAVLFALIAVWPLVRPAGRAARPGTRREAYDQATPGKGRRPAMKCISI